MNIRVGTDLVEIERFKRKSTSSPSILKNLFNPSELRNSDPVHLAGIFSAKEAALKAQKEGDWSAYGEEISRLGEIINKMQTK